jgi:hypothetical protein
VPHHLAELNIARLRHPLDHTATSEFVAVLGVINQLAELSPGFVWRLQDESGRSSSYVQASSDPLVIVNLTVWTDVESLQHFTYKSGHGAYFRRRREWFEPLEQPNMVCWWIADGETPTLDDAMRRLELLRTRGPGDDAFAFSAPRPAPGARPLGPDAIRRPEQAPTA